VDFTEQYFAGDARQTPGMERRGPDLAAIGYEEIGRAIYQAATPKNPRR
jgi:hypothetical protein